MNNIPIPLYQFIHEPNTGILHEQQTTEVD